MSRRSRHWRRLKGHSWQENRAIPNPRTLTSQGGGTLPPLPSKAEGDGSWLGTGQGKGNVCTLPMSREMEEKVRRWTK